MSIFKKYLFDNKISINNYYIPDRYSEIILLVCRNLYDKKGKWLDKHVNRIKELFDKNINQDILNMVSCSLYDTNYLYNMIIDDNIRNICKPTISFIHD